MYNACDETHMVATSDRPFATVSQETGVCQSKLICFTRTLHDIPKLVCYSCSRVLLMRIKALYEKNLSLVLPLHNLMSIRKGALCLEV